MEKRIGKNISNSNSKINNIIFKELLKRGYSLEGKNKVWNISDSKLWYLTPDQAKAFLDLEEKDPKQVMFAKKEVELIKKHFDELISGVKGKPINVVDLGCGNGKKALSFMILSKNKSKIRYCPVDINGFMVDRAIQTVSKLNKIELVKSKNNILDFVEFNKVSDLFRKSNFKINYLLLLGGNLENSDAHELLHEIRSSMKDGDYLLIGNKLTHPDPNKMVDYYVNNKKIDNMMVKTVEQLGLSKREVQYGARFRGSRIEMFYILKVNKNVSLNGKKVEFQKGDKIIVAISYKYTKDSLLELLMMYFDNIESFVSKDGIFALALCRK